MPTYYVRSTDGLNGDSGLTWALAKATLGGASSISAPGDNIYVSQVHAETGAVNVVLTFNGTIANPVKIVAGNDAAAPPTTISTAATLTTTGATNITIGGHLYMYGVRFNSGTGTGATLFILCGQTAGEIQTYERCQFVLVNTDASSRISSNSNYVPITWKDCDVKFAHVGQSVDTLAMVWDGGSILSGSSAPIYLIRAAATATCVGETTLRNLDLSNGGTGLIIFYSNTGLQTGKFSISNSKLPASWVGSLVGGTLATNQRFSMYNCDSAGTNYKVWVQTHTGTIREETTVVRTGGASDGVTAYSLKLVTTANAIYPGTTLDTDPIVLWNNTTGSAKTLTVEILRDSVTSLTDAEIWLEVDYYGASGSPQATKITDAAANILATAANQTTSSATWTTTGLTNPNKQALAVTFTPQLKGFYKCVVRLAKASSTVYVDPRIVVS